MTRHEAELLFKKRVTRRLIEELSSAPPPAGRLPAVRLKPSRCVVCSVASCSPSSSSCVLAGCESAPGLWSLGDVSLTLVDGALAQQGSLGQVRVAHGNLAPGCEEEGQPCVWVPCFS